jgi:hypothetical protein
VAISEKRCQTRGDRTEKRVHVKLVRFAPSELRLVMHRARAAGRPLACYIRDASLGTATRARRASASDELIRHLARLAGRLGKLSQAAAEQHLQGGVADYDAALAEVMDTIRRLD